jgi:hypothetical protein
MPHTHTWAVATYVLLGLPRDGFAERLVHWACRTCPQYCVMTGDLKLGIALATPEFWDQVQRSPAYQRTPEARMAREQDRWRVR